jgi:chemotaxis protein histidine kinase CheA
MDAKQITRAQLIAAANDVSTTLGFHKSPGGAIKTGDDVADEAILGDLVRAINEGDIAKGDELAAETVEVLKALAPEKCPQLKIRGAGAAPAAPADPEAAAKAAAEKAAAKKAEKEAKAAEKAKAKEEAKAKKAAEKEAKAAEKAKAKEEAKAKKAAEKAAAKEPRITRPFAVGRAFQTLRTQAMTFDEFVDHANETCGKLGLDPNLRETTSCTRYGINCLSGLGILKADGDKFSLV